MVLCWPYCDLIKYLLYSYIWWLSRARGSADARSPAADGPEPATQPRTAHLSSLTLFWLAWVLFPRISWQVKMSVFEVPRRGRFPVGPQCAATAPAFVCLVLCLLLLLCSKYPSFNEVKLFNYYFSLWNGSWSLGLLILSDWKEEENPLNNFPTPSRGFLSKPRNSCAAGEAERSVTAPAQPGFSPDYIFFQYPQTAFFFPCQFLLMSPWFYSCCSLNMNARGPFFLRQCKPGILCHGIPLQSSLPGGWLFLWCADSPRPNLLRVSK